jgi:hypothetical protein
VKLYDPSGSHKDDFKWDLPDRKLFEKITLPEPAQYKGFKIELIYNGISKNTIRITYREFSGDMARPAFYQDSTYDLDQSKEIHFKSIKMKVLEADNSKLRLVVLDDGGIPWFPRPK